MRRVGDRVRIVAQLIDAATGQHLWAETYDRQLTDIFAIQTDVALHIAAALKAELSPGERERIRREPTGDVQAYEQYLRGRQCLVRFTVDGDPHAASSTSSGRSSATPGSRWPTSGWRWRTRSWATTGSLTRDQAGGRAMAAAGRALELDPELGDAHGARAYARLVYELDWAAAEAGFKRALELSPGNADIYDLYGRMCAGLERFDEAIALQRRAQELDPLTHRGDLATTLMRAGRDEEAARVAARAIQLDPHDPRLHATLGWALFRQGRVDEGLAELERARRAGARQRHVAGAARAGVCDGGTGRARPRVLRRLEDPSRPVPASPYHLAYVHTGLGDAERAMDCLERAYEEGSRVGVRDQGVVPLRAPAPPSPVRGPAEADGRGLSGGGRGGSRPAPRLRVAAGHRQGARL